MRLGASELRSVLQFARASAIASDAETAVKFRKVNEEWIYGLYRDGDGDGVRNADISAGIDRRIPSPPGIPERLSVAAIGLPRIAVRVPDTDTILRPGEDPIRFGGSLLCSFSPLGSATPGSIYVTDRLRAAAAVRVFGATGRIRIVLCREAVPR